MRSTKNKNYSGSAAENQVFKILKHEWFKLLIERWTLKFFAAFCLVKITALFHKECYFYAFL